jgi:hypothetical protein
MRYPLKGLGAAVALGFATSPVNAQAPGYDETAAYIIERCNDTRGNGYLITNMQFDGPFLRYDVVFTVTEDFRKIEFDLREIDPVRSISWTNEMTSRPGMYIYCREGAECSKINDYKRNNGAVIPDGVNYSDYTQLNCRENERAFRAILHMHELAGPAEHDPFAE